MKEPSSRILFVSVSTSATTRHHPEAPNSTHAKTSIASYMQWSFGNVLRKEFHKLSANEFVNAHDSCRSLNVM
uniref:Solute carrier organic anion transporter family member n=1 Tax=Parascaris univalens TaxID=6257 RepID=A0A915BMW9_PARUN